MNLDRPALDQAEVDVLSDRGVDLWPECGRRLQIDVFA